MKLNDVIPLKCTEESFYRLWMEFMTPFHKLTPRERDVAARIIAQYFRLKESIPDPEVLRDVLWSQKSRKDMRESLKMSQAHFQMVLAKLRENQVLVDDTLNPAYIPHKGDSPRYLLGVFFDWSSPENPIKNEK
jgi:hypothetical protein